MRRLLVLGVCALSNACSTPAAAPEPAARPQPPQAARAAAPQPAAPAPVANEPARVRRSVELTILGDFPSDFVPDIERALQSELEVEVLPTRYDALPAQAYYPPRKRYRAEKLLDHLERRLRPGTSQLGLTDVDISTTKGSHADWGVFGLGSLGGDSAVISTRRLTRDRPSAELYRFRVTTTALHEVGHMLGLDHCPEPHCLMNDAEGSIRTVDQSTGKLGPECRRQLDRLSPRDKAPLGP